MRRSVIVLLAGVVGFLAESCCLELLWWRQTERYRHNYFVNLTQSALAKDVQLLVVSATRIRQAILFVQAENLSHHRTRDCGTLDHK